MDSGGVVWLPGSGYDQQYENWVCEMNYGGFYFECGSEPYMDGTLITCCI